MSAGRLRETIRRSPDIPIPVGPPHGDGSLHLSVPCGRRHAGLPAPGSAGPLGSMRTRPPAPAPTRRGQPPAPAPHPRIADVHNGGGARGSQRIVNAQSAAAALQGDAGAARPGLGLALGLRAHGSGGGRGGAHPAPGTGRKCAPPNPPSWLLGQCRGWAGAGGGARPRGGARRGAARANGPASPGAGRACRRSGRVQRAGR